MKKQVKIGIALLVFSLVLFEILLYFIGWTNQNWSDLSKIQQIMYSANLFVFSILNIFTIMASFFLITENI